MSPGTPTLNGLSSSNRLSKNTLCWMSNLVTQAQWRCVYEACLCADIADSCPRNKNEMDALQDNLIHFHWQDVISDTEECRERWVSAPRGGGAQERMEEKPERKMLGGDDNNGERSHCATSRAGRGRSECQICLWRPGDDTGQLSNPEGGSSSVKWVPVIFSVTGQGDDY